MEHVPGAQSASIASYAGLWALAIGLAAALIAVRAWRAHTQAVLLRALGLDATARRFEYGSRRLIARVAEQKAHGRRHLFLSTPAPELPRLSIMRLRALDRLARCCHLATIVPSGNRDFDRRHLIDCDYRELAGALLRAPAAREAMQTLFDLGARTITLARGQLRAQFDIAALLPADTAEAKLHRWGHALAELATALPPFTGALTPVTTAWKARRLMLLVTCALAPIAALAACMIGYETYPPLDLPALVRDALAALPLALPAALLPGLVLLRGHPTSGRLLTPLVAAVIAATPPALVAAALLRNGHGEAQARHVVVVEVTGRERLADTVPPRYRWLSAQLQARGLFGSPRPIVAEVPEAVWQQTPLDRAHIELHIAAGRLGHAWLAAVRPLTDPPHTAPPPPAPVPATDEAPHAAIPQTSPRTLALAPSLPTRAASGAVLLAQAHAHERAGALTEALRLLDEAIIALQAENAPATLRAQAHAARAALYGRLGSSFEKQREADARAALALAPAQLEAALILDEVLVRRARHEEALQLWTLVLQQRPDDRSGRFHLARTLATLGRTDEARAAADAACSAGEAPACTLRDSL
ncbi:hypothetical protein SAMN04488120_10788 [Fontimonas thermophila]|uniref:Tetratricopeptide repeat-containing protein n=1 Tax=Fontimonas thermophila TaxID=1076937 RepID=A0A1I2JKZ3_9GAMM|nr:hypothetical protein [Fontimonas thermophila]SFF53456.1 hypothetical protein SAMN04488120_10788 [Fontimonas thermophila]